MKLVVKEEIKNKYTNATSTKEEIFNYINNKAGGVLDNGVMFVSDYNTEDKTAVVSLVRQIGKEEFEAFDTREISLDNGTSYNETTADLQIESEFNLVK